MKHDNYFFIIHLILLLVVLVGFTPSFYLRSLSDQEALPIYLIVHGITCTVWFMVALLRSAFIRTKSVRLHRTLGYYFSLIAPIVTLTGFWVMKDKIQRYYLIAESPSAAGRPNPQTFESMLIWSDILVLLSFLVIIYLGYRNRHKLQFHKRMMLFGSVMIVPQAFVRLGKISFLQIGDDPGASGSLYAVIGPVLILLSLLVYDRYLFGRVHKATKIAWIWYILLLVSAMVIMRSGLGMNILEMMR